MQSLVNLPQASVFSGGIRKDELYDEGTKMCT